MKEKPDIVKMLEEEERLGMLQSRVQKSYEELETSGGSSEDVPSETTGFFEEDVEPKTRVDDTEDGDAENKLQEILDRYKLIFDNVSDEIIYVNKHGKIVDVNRRSYDIFGYKPEEIIGKNFSKLGWFGMKDLPKLLKLFKGAIRGKTIDLMELEVKHRDGHIVPVEVSTRPVKKNGKTVGFLSIVRDITERKKAEETQRENEERYRDLFENANDLIQAVKPDGSFLYVNRAWKKALGYTENEITNLNIFDIIHPDSKDHCTEVFKRIMSGKSIDKVEASFVTKDGKEIAVEGSISCRFADGKPVSTRGIFRDVTKQKQAINEIENAKQELETKNKELENTIKYADRVSLETKNALTELDQIFNTSGNGMLVLDKDFHILKMNDTFSTMFGISKAEAIGRKCYEVLNEPACHTNNCPMKDILDGEERVEFETGIEHADGTGIPCSLTATPFKKVDGEIIGVIEDFKDITEWKKAEERIKKQNVELEKLNTLKSAFLNITSHELRTPMSSIKGYIQMLLKEKLGEVNKDQKGALEVILRNANRLDNLIQDILDVSRLESGNMKFIPENTAIGRMVEEIAETMQASAVVKDIKLNTEIGKDIPDLFIDQMRTKQVIINLTNNAIKFSPDGSVINLKVKKEQENVLFEVQDFGRGIPKDKQERVFETFYQVDSGKDTKFGGAGLGLAISRGIVIAHGGKIWVESEGIPGKGSTFRFILPVKSVKDIEERFKGVDIFRLGKENDTDEKKNGV